MPFPNENEFGSRCGRLAAQRVNYFAGSIQFLAFLKTYGLSLPDFGYGVFMSQSFEIPAGGHEERKAQADKVAEKFGATPEWHNGYYMAVREDANLRMVIHFFPPILASDAEAAA